MTDRKTLYGSLAIVLLSGAVVLIASARRAAWWSAPSLSVPEPPALPAATSSAAAEPPEPAGAEGEATCAIPDRGNGVWPSDFHKLPLGRMLVPTPPPAEHYDLLIHLHGGEAARKVVAPLARPDLVLVAIDAGVGSQAYAEALSEGDSLPGVLAAVDAALRPATLRRLIVSSWSAGYGGVRVWLSQHPTTINDLVMLDSIHASYEPDGESLVQEGLTPFRSFAERAAHGEARLIVTHSEIRPPGYASTSEVASWLIAELHGQRSYAGLVQQHGVALKTRFDKNKLSIRGYTGRGKEAHCAHVMLLADILRDDVFAPP